MNDAMEESKSKVAKKRKPSSTIVADEEEMPSDKLVNVDAEEENNETESNDDPIHLRLHTKITKSPSKGPKGSKKEKTQKKNERKYK